MRLAGSKKVIHQLRDLLAIFYTWDEFSEG